MINITKKTDENTVRTSICVNFRTENTKTKIRKSIIGCTWIMNRKDIISELVDRSVRNIQSDTWGGGEWKL